MKTTLLTLAAVLALAAAAGCDRTPDQRANPTPPTPASSGASSAPATPQANTPSTPANVGTPSSTEQKNGSSPVQGQVDPKQPAQREDFQKR